MKTVLPIIRTSEPEAQRRLANLPFEEDSLWEQVAAIVAEVRAKGDEALLEYTARFDGCALREDQLLVNPEEIAEAYQQVDDEFIQAIRKAGANIQSFHEKQKQQDWISQDETGSLVGQVFRPMDRVGIYVPGGTANYPSSVLMTALPAKVAGVAEIVMVTPPSEDGKIPEATLVAAREAGVTEIYRIGGAQAIAALAYGTSTIKRVDKIVGPGNIYVTLAKKMVYGTVGIDMLAGPSEILIVGDGSVKAEFAAANLLSQAEHDSKARAILLTPSESYAQEVASEVDRQLAQLPRKEIAAKALTDQGAIIIVEDLIEAFQLANQVAPEHLELLVQEPLAHLSKVKHAGAIFLGPYSPEPLGDYWAGPNHVLPTAGTARYNSPLNVADFCKCSSLIAYTEQGLRQAGAEIQVLTKWESLTAHGQAIAVRMEDVKK